MPAMPTCKHEIMQAAITDLSDSQRHTSCVCEDTERVFGASLSHSTTYIPKLEF